MGGPAAGGALGPELPDLIILEVGVDEIAQGRPLGAKGARRRRRRAGRLTRVWPCADGWDPASRHAPAARPDASSSPAGSVIRVLSKRDG